MDVGWIKGWMLMNVFLTTVLITWLMLNDTLSERQPEMDIFYPPGFHSSNSIDGLFSQETLLSNPLPCTR